MHRATVDDGARLDQNTHVLSSEANEDKNTKGLPFSTIFLHTLVYPNPNSGILAFYLHGCWCGTPTTTLTRLQTAVCRMIPR